MLEPYVDLIAGLRKRRWTYRKIAAILRDQFGVTTGRSSVHDFVKARAMTPRSESMPEPATSESLPSHPAPVKRRFRLDI